jgi:hypothetical protein
LFVYRDVWIDRESEGEMKGGREGGRDLAGVLAQVDE